MKALLIVDVQNDFLPGGALPAPEGRKIIPEINKLMDRFDLIVASKDWHPEKTVHFEKWPPHCIKETAGADFPAGLDQSKINTVVLKGTNNVDDGYSAFEATSINLDHYLREQGVEDIYIAGLTTEYCVKNTVLDALKLGYTTYVFKDAVAGVQAHPGDEEHAWHEMNAAGAKIITILELS